VYFKREEQRGIAGRARPIVSAAAAASLLVASCSPAEPVITLERPAMAPDKAQNAEIAPRDEIAPQDEAPTTVNSKETEKGKAKAAGKDGEADGRSRWAASASRGTRSALVFRL
jgi:hypothetical protein